MRVVLKTGHMLFLKRERKCTARTKRSPLTKVKGKERKKGVEIVEASEKEIRIGPETRPKSDSLGRYSVRTMSKKELIPSEKSVKGHDLIG